MLFSLFLSTILSAQATTFRDIINPVFANVNKTRVSTGYLKEYGYPFLDMGRFDGVSQADSSVLDMAVWRRLFGCFVTSYVGNTINPTGQQINSLNNINANIDAKENLGYVPISLLFTQYNDIRPDALTAQLLIANNNQLYENTTPQANPYRTQTLFAAAPSRSYSNVPTTQFYFDGSFIQTNFPGIYNSSLTIYPSSGGSLPNYTISADFSDGLGFRTVTLNSAINVSWALTGTYNIRVKITNSSSGAVVMSQFNFTCYTASCTGCLAIEDQKSLDHPSFLATTTHTLNTDFAGHSGGDVKYILSAQNPTNSKYITNGTNKIRKPLIIVEGFDASNNLPQFFDSYTLKNFLNELLLSGSIDGTNIDLNTKLDLAGYDLIFLNYAVGTDDIRRNANFFQNVLRVVNSVKEGTEPCVVFGSSMGGLVTRYGLANIVKNGYFQDPRLPATTSHDPQTRLLITHDSPHRGANIPLGLQFLVNRLYLQPAIPVGIAGFTISIKDLVPALEGAYSLFNYAPAPKNMLLYRATGIGTNDYATNTFLIDGGPYRTMVDNLPNNPLTNQPYYQLSAMSNGSQCAQKIFDPNSFLATADGAGGGGLGILNFSGSAQLKLRATPEQNTIGLPIVDFQFILKTQFLIFTFSNYEINYVVNSPNIIPYDGSSGGLTSFPTKIGEKRPGSAMGGSIKSVVIDLLSSYYYTLLSPQVGFCFLPTGSALDASGFIYSRPAIDQIYANNFNPSPSVASTFPNFLAQAQQNSITYVGSDKNTVLTGNFYNAPHISFNTRNSKWLFEKITNSASSNQECTTECKPDITGPKLLCNYEYYSINSGGAPVTWVANPSNAAYIYLLGGGNALLVKNTNAYFTLTASFQSGACTITSNPLNIEAGTVPMPFFSLLGPYSPVCPGGTANFTASVVDPNIEYTWSCISGNCGAVQSSSYGIGHSSNTYSVSSYATTGTSFTIQATGTRSNICGTSAVPISSTFTVQIGGNCFAFFSVALSPNPASNVLNVSITDKSPNAKDDDEFEVTIADLVGNVKHDKKYKTKDNQIDISSLKTGNYSLRLIKTSGTDVVTKSFSVVK